MKKPKYTIERPPLSPTFDLPTREEILKLTKGRTVKLSFFSPQGDGERMWVTITECFETNKWQGELDNDPFIVEAKRGDIVQFHPLDIIDIYPDEDKNIIVGVSYTEDSKGNKKVDKECIEDEFREKLKKVISRLENK